jgi:iron complex outermembrane receptor protein
MKRLQTRSIALTFCISLWISGSASAQTAATGRVEGQVIDSQQLALTQAAVTLEKDGSPARQVVSNDEGRYQFENVEPGRYKVRVRRSGFSPVDREDVTVTAGQGTVVDVTLSVSTVSESITVTADNDRLVASRTEIPLRELPVTVQIVSRETLSQQGATDLVRALYNVPNTNSFTLYGMYEYFVFRGFGFDNIVGSSVLLDGMRLEGNRMNSQLNSIESVEVLKGPASMLYGTEATGGTINLVRKKPSSVRNYEGVVRGGSWGRFGAEFGATGPVKTDRLLYRLDIGFDRADGWRGAGWNRFNTTPSVNYRLTNKDQLNFVVGYNEERYKGDAGIPLLRPASEPNPFKSTIIPNIPFDTRYNPPADFQATRDILPQMFYTHMFSENTRLRNAFTYRYFDDQYLVTETLSVDPVKTPNLVDREFFYFFHHRRPLQNQTDFLTTVKTGKISHQIVVGYDLLWYQNQTERSAVAGAWPLGSVSLLNPKETFTQKISNFPPFRMDEQTNAVNAVYFQDFVRLTPKWTALFSGRYDGFRRTAFRNPVVNGVETLTTPAKIQQDPFTYRLATNYQATSWMGVYASYGTSFRAQTSLSADGKNLKPETGDQWEIGERFSLLHDRLTLNTTLFRLVKRNYTVSRANGIFDQAGEAESKGFEADLRGRITSRLRVQASYGFTQAQFKNSELEDGDGVIRDVTGRTPAFAPRHTQSFWGIYDVTRKWQVALGERYIGRAPVNNFNYVYMGGYTLWNAAVFYRTNKADYSVNLNNFLNKDRYIVASINDYLVYPGKPFEVTGTIRFHF